MNNKKRPGYIGPSKPISHILDSKIMEAIKEAKKEENRILTELFKAQTNENANDLMKRFKENQEAITKLMETLRETMRDMI